MDTVTIVSISSDPDGAMDPNTINIVAVYAKIVIQQRNTTASEEISSQTWQVEAVTQTQ